MDFRHWNAQPSPKSFHSISIGWRIDGRYMVLKWGSQCQRRYIPLLVGEIAEGLAWKQNGVLGEGLDSQRQLRHLSGESGICSETTLLDFSRLGFCWFPSVRSAVHQRWMVDGGQKLLYVLLLDGSALLQLCSLWFAASLSYLRVASVKLCHPEYLGWLRNRVPSTIWTHDDASPQRWTGVVQRSERTNRCYMLLSQNFNMSAFGKDRKSSEIYGMVWWTFGLVISCTSLVALLLRRLVQFGRIISVESCTKKCRHVTNFDTN